jgi:hypothetical protein
LTKKNVTGSTSPFAFGLCNLEAPLSQDSQALTQVHRNLLNQITDITYRSSVSNGDYTVFFIVSFSLQNSHFISQLRPLPQLFPRADNAAKGAGTRPDSEGPL